MSAAETCLYVCAGVSEAGQHALGRGPNLDLPPSGQRVCGRGEEGIGMECKVEASGSKRMGEKRRKGGGGGRERGMRMEGGGKEERGEKVKSKSMRVSSQEYLQG